ncbi:Gldg family protein [Thermopetrobacter sp. TC1]|uniref:GldG family protein n=1 Tax=Thermopetrobacter sp. TC1 TaxID=1495045 RepID=UPI0005716F51|nr:Gldg family protein [Thermopetrobacter sp. TC1]
MPKNTETDRATPQLPESRGLSDRARALIAVVLAFVALAGVNLFASQMLRIWRADFTEERLFTISDVTRKELARIEEPITIRFYFSKILAEKAPLYAEFGARVQALLRQYADLSGGKLRVELVDPEPFSPEEDRAIAAGLQAIPLGDGRNAWFGIIGENMTDQQEVIPFLSAERASRLEYDLTRLVHKLNNPRRKVVGVLTALPAFGGMDPFRGARKEWAMMLQLREFFDVRPIEKDAKDLPPLDALIIATPVKMNEDLARAVDDFALSGKPVIVFADPWNEASATIPDLIDNSVLREDDDIVRMLKSWGVSLKLKRVVGDIELARRVVFRFGGREQVGSYLVWLQLERKTFVKPDDPLFTNVNLVLAGSVGALEKAKDAKVTFTPLIRSTPKTMLFDTDKLAVPNPVELLAAYKPSGKPAVLAARITGEAVSAFAEKDGAKKADKKAEQAGKTAGPDGKTPEKTAEKAPQKAKAQNDSGLRDKGRVNLLVIADSDLLSDRFWAQRRELSPGKTLILPAADNATLLLNALEQMTGGAALSGLRGRSLKKRPFERVEAIRRQAEQKFRQREKELQEKLKDAEKRLSSITARVEGNRVVISEEDRELILKVRAEILKLRRALRDVQRALVRDIERLGLWLKAVNIAGVAIIVAIIAVIVALMRRAQARRARRLAREG